MGRKRHKSSSSVVLRICKKMLVVTIFVGVPLAIFLFSFQVKKVNVVGVGHYSEQQIKDMIIQTKPDSNTLYLFLKHKYFVKTDIPFIEKLDVKMTDRHTITINVYEKMVAGCVEFMGDYFYFDKDGIVVESSSQRLKEVPLVKGLKFNEIILTKKLNVQKDELFTAIINIAQLIQKYELEVDTVSFNKNYEVTVECNDIKVLLGKKSTYDEVLSDLKNILKEAERVELEELDMRNYKKGTGYVIGKPKKSTE